MKSYLIALQSLIVDIERQREAGTLLTLCRHFECRVKTLLQLRNQNGDELRASGGDVGENKLMGG